MLVEIEIDDDVLAWLQSQGDDWQERMNAVLQSFMEASKAEHATPEITCIRSAPRGPLARRSSWRLARV
jgi:hypothetical protein